MKQKLVYLIPLLFFCALAKADDLCTSPAILKSKVNYCDENLAYYEAGLACKNKYLQEVKVQRERIEKELAEQVKAIDNNAQNKDLENSGEVLSNTIDDLEYLIDFGKQVHTELEDYVYDLVLPIFDDEDAKANLSDPAVKKDFMGRECYGDPASQLELMQKELQPIIEEFEKTKDMAVTLAIKTGHYEKGLDAKSSQNVKVPSEGEKANNLKGRKPVKPARGKSDITSQKPLPSK